MATWPLWVITSTYSPDSSAVAFVCTSSPKASKGQAVSHRSPSSGLHEAYARRATSRARAGEVKLHAGSTGRRHSGARGW